MFNKKGQAAMEFLMTYGWAILVVLAAIGALAYFGVLSPDAILPERTTFQAPLPNVDTAYIDGANQQVEVAFTNSVGYPVVVLGTGYNITSMEVDGSSTSCTPTSIVGNGSSIPNGETFTVKIDCGATTWTAAKRFKGTMTFQYNNTYTGQVKKHTGTINGKVA